MRPATDALIVIDVQNDFCPGGALAVAEGDEIICRINGLMGEFATVVLTQDWHPANHASFADNHPGAEPFTLKGRRFPPRSAHRPGASDCPQRLSPRDRQLFRLLRE